MLPIEKAASYISKCIITVHASLCVDIVLGLMVWGYKLTLYRVHEIIILCLCWFNRINIKFSCKNQLSYHLSFNTSKLSFNLSGSRCSVYEDIYRYLCITFYVNACHNIICSCWHTLSCFTFKSRIDIQGHPCGFYFVYPISEKHFRSQR